MAGIGFRLQKLLHQGTYFSSLQGFFFATYLVAGPWIVTVLVIGILSWITTLTGAEYDIFRTSIVYLYAFSLIFTGMYQMPLTRFLADEMFSGRLESLASSYLGMTMVIALLQGTTGFLFALILPLSWLYRTVFVAGLVIVSLLWLAGIYLGCLRDYEKIGLYFILGSLISFVGSVIGEQHLGLDGAFLGFVAGQGVVLLGLTYRILNELGFPGLTPSIAALSCLRAFPVHLLVGFLYNLAIWIDKVVYWFSEPYGQEACRGLLAFGHYDTAVFLAYVTIIPALGIYLMNVETDFYDTYRAFYGAILRQMALHQLYDRLADIRRNLRFTFFEMVKFQGAITLLIFYFAPEILAKINFPEELVGTLRWAVLGAFFQVLFLFVSLFLLYFEFAVEALLGNALFFLINAGTTWWICANRLDEYLAAGYLISALTAFLVSGFLLVRRMKKLVAITFLRQPIPGEAYAEPPLLGQDGFIGDVIFVRRREAQPARTAAATFPQ